MSLLSVATGMVTPDPLGQYAANDPDLASYLRIEERELGFLQSP
jgi:hypothetical protein